MGLAPTNYQRTVILSNPSLNVSKDQKGLRYLLTLAPAHLITDISTNLPAQDTPLPSNSNSPPPSPTTPALSTAELRARAEAGLESWAKGFRLLTDHVLLLHSANLLHLDTLNEASRACSECWSVAATYPGGAVRDQSRDVVRGIAAKLRTILDSNQVTYRGGIVYVP